MIPVLLFLLVIESVYVNYYFLVLYIQIMMHCFMLSAGIWCHISSKSWPAEGCTVSGTVFIIVILESLVIAIY